MPRTRRHCYGCNRNVIYRCNACGDCTTMCCRCPSVEFFKATDPSAAWISAKNSKINLSKRFLGTEIEVAKVSKIGGKKVTEVLKNWGGAIVHDGSLPVSGFEINTVPASGDTWLQQIKEITEALKKGKAKVTTDCGLHMHVDASDFSLHDIYRLIKVYAHIEPILFQMVPKSRRNNHYAEKCGQKYLKNFPKEKLNYGKTKESLVKAIYGNNYNANLYNRHSNESRYKALNIHSWFYRATIEIRLFNGTIDYEKITRWGMLIATIMDYVYNSDNKKIDREIIKYKEPLDYLLHILKGKRKLQNFVKKRIKEFDAQGKKKPKVTTTRTRAIRTNNPTVEVPLAPNDSMRMAA